jgi:hypothetical protein
MQMQLKWGNETLFRKNLIPRKELKTIKNNKKQI